MSRRSMSLEEYRRGVRSPAATAAAVAAARRWRPAVSGKKPLWWMVARTSLLRRAKSGDHEAQTVLAEQYQCRIWTTEELARLNRSRRRPR